MWDLSDINIIALDLKHSQTQFEKSFYAMSGCSTLSSRQIFTGLTVLRKLCNHPDLVTNDYRDCATNGREDGEEEGEGEDADETAFIRSRRPQRRRRRLSTRSSEAKREGERRYREERFGWGKRSGKMIVVEALLKMWSEQKHRVLLFSQSKMVRSLYTYVQYIYNSFLLLKQQWLWLCI